MKPSQAREDRNVLLSDFLCQFWLRDSDCILYFFFAQGIRALVDLMPFRYSVPGTNGTCCSIPEIKDLILDIEVAKNNKRSLCSVSQN